MRHSPGFYRRLAFIALESDLVRVGLGLLTLAAMVMAGLPPLLTLAFPLATYVGLCLLATPALHSSLDRRPRRPTGAWPEASVACVRLARRIDAHATRIQDADSSAHACRIVTWIERCREVIAADGKSQAAAGLIGLSETTDRLLVAYLKVADRGFDCAELRDRLRDNLADLDGEYERFWVRLNRDTVVDLEALSASIEVNLNQLGLFARPGGRS